MDVDLAQEMLNALGTSLENLETQQVALLQYLKDNGIVQEDQFAPYLTQAGKASSVRWRAARVRLESLFAREKEREEQRAEKEKRDEADRHAEKDQKAEKERNADNEHSQNPAAEAPTEEQSREEKDKSDEASNHK